MKQMIIQWVEFSSHFKRSEWQEDIKLPFRWVNRLENVPSYYDASGHLLISLPNVKHT